MSARKPSKPTEALLRQFVELPRDQQWSFLVKVLRHYAEGIKIDEPEERKVA